MTDVILAIRRHLWQSLAAAGLSPSNGAPTDGTRQLEYRRMGPVDPALLTIAHTARHRLLLAELWHAEGPSASPCRRHWLWQYAEDADPDDAASVVGGVVVDWLAAAKISAPDRHLRQTG